jgi:hypothetical protein
MMAIWNMMGDMKRRETLTLTVMVSWMWCRLLGKNVGVEAQKLGEELAV